MTKRLGHGRKSVNVEILKAIKPGEGHKGLIVMIEGGRADEISERIIIDTVSLDFQGRVFMPK